MNSSSHLPLTMTIITKEPTPEIYQCDLCGHIAHIASCPTYRYYESWERPQMYTVVCCPRDACDGWMEPYALSMPAFAIWRQNTKNSLAAWWEGSWVGWQWYRLTSILTGKGDPQ